MPHPLITKPFKKMSGSRNEMSAPTDWPRQRLIESLMTMVNLTAPGRAQRELNEIALQEERKRATALLDAVTR